MTKTLKRIGTHDGVFHCDEVLACFMLRRLPEFTNSDVIRTRDEKILDTCDVVVDVGHVYDPERQRFDHHQKEFDHTMNSLVPSRKWKVKLSSAGLVYHHYGERILEAILGSPQDPVVLKSLFDFVYENLIQEVDGIDNGVPMFDGEPKYTINTNLSSRVKYLNRAWNDTEPYDSQKYFHVAMDMVGREFIERIHYFTKCWWPARQLVREAIENRHSVHESGEIIELKQPCPWKDHLSQLEEEMDLSGVIKFAIFKSDNWRVQGVPVEPESFVLRLPLHSDWRGLREDELRQKSGISDCFFVHSAGFVGGSRTREGALEMAVKTIKLNADSVKE